MLISQYMSVDNDKKGTVHLYNTFDTGLAQRLAKEASEAGGGRVGEGSGEMRLMGYIPPEMWMCDPWLIMGYFNNSLALQSIDFLEKAVTYSEEDMNNDVAAANDDLPEEEKLPFYDYLQRAKAAYPL